MITPPATVGVLGGGQLGRYFVLAAHTMGYRTVVLEPDPSAPAGKVADVHLVADYDDPAALDQLGTQCAVVTTEFENPPASALARLAAHTTVHPSPGAIAIAQDRRAEKEFFRSIGVPTAPFVAIETEADIAAATAATYPAILKTSRLGYDGKGQVHVPYHGDLATAWDHLDRAACVLERRLPLDREVSVLVARNSEGQSVLYPLAENVHVNGILDLTVVPATPTPGANELATAIATELDYVGVLAVEMFVVGGHVLVNEIAPRPHNSGHWTLDASATSQFEQQVRAVCGLGLGSTHLTAPAVAMVNLLGELWDEEEPRWEDVLVEPTVKLHLYGKAQARPGRKMGHLTVTADSPAQAAASARHLRDRLRRDTGRLPIAPTGTPGITTI